MDLDRRAAEAADLLRADVGAEIDPDAAYADVLAGVGRRRTRTAGVRLGVAALVALIAVGAIAAVTAGGGSTGDGDDVADRDRDGVEQGEVALETDDGLTERAAQILGGLPDGPLDGKESQRLPVVAEPADGLEEGDEVTLYGKGFEPGELVGAVHCGAEADVANAGVDACDLGDASYAFANTVTGSARADGSVVITVTVRRHISTPSHGKIDCASGPERCLFAIGASGDYDRSGGTYFQMAGAPGFPEASSSIDPAGPYTVGQQVTVTGTSLVPHRQYQVEQCAGAGHCAMLATGRATPEGTYGATVAIAGSIDVDGEVRACEDACTLQVRGVGLEEQTTADPPAPIPLGPLDGDQSTVASTPETPTTTEPGLAEGAPPIDEAEPVDPGQAPPAATTAPPATATSPEPPETTTTAPGSATTTTTP